MAMFSLLSNAQPGMRNNQPDAQPKCGKSNSGELRKRPWVNRISAAGAFYFHFSVEYRK
jgi:hypothetical protein